MADEPPARAGCPRDGEHHAPAVVRALAEEAALGERQLRARPRAPAGQPRGQAQGARGIPFLRALRGGAHAPATAHRRTGGRARRHLLPAPPRGVLEGQRQGPHPDEPAYRQPRGCRAGHRPPRLADRLARRRHELSGAVRAPAAAAQGLGHHAHPVAQPAGHVRRAPPERDPRADHRLGVSAGGHSRPHVRRVDDASGRACGAGGKDRGPDRPHRHPARTRRQELPGHARCPDPGALVRSGRAASSDAGDRGRAGGDDRRGAGAVVQLQADLALDRRGAGGSSPRRAGALAPAG